MTTPPNSPQIPPPLRDEPQDVLKWVFVGPAGIRAGWSILIYAFLLVSVGILIVFAEGPLLLRVAPPKGASPAWWMLLIPEVTILAVVAIATFLMSLIEKRKFSEYWLKDRFGGGKFAAGAVMGLGFTVIRRRLLVAVFEPYAKNPFPGVAHTLKYAVKRSSSPHAITLHQAVGQTLQP